MALLPGRGLRLLVATVLVAGGMAAAPSLATADAPTPTPIYVLCSTTADYGGSVNCSGGPTDTSGASKGSLVFDPGNTAPGTWTGQSCADASGGCFGTLVLSTPPGAAPTTVTFPVSFTNPQGAVSTETVSIAVGLRVTTTGISCDATDATLGGTMHCVLSVTDVGDYPHVAAQLPAGSHGVGITSSDPADTFTYDHPSSAANTCAPTAASVVTLSCGFTVHLGPKHGLHTLTASYLGDPTADELASQGSTTVADGHRDTVTIGLSCPGTVPAATLLAHCTVTVVQPSGSVKPTGTVTFSDDIPSSCALVAGSCAADVHVETPFQDQVFPVYAAYAGDDNFMPGTSSGQTVNIIATPTTASLVCDSATVAIGSSTHCELSVSAAGLAVMPFEYIALTATDNADVVTCDVDRCGPDPASVNSATELYGFTVTVGEAAGQHEIDAKAFGNAYFGTFVYSTTDSTATYDFTATPPVVQPVTPPVTPPAAPVVPAAPPPAGTSLSVTCLGPVVYGHASACTATVASTAGTPSGTVTFAAGAGFQGSVGSTCLLSAHGGCYVTVAPALVPGAHSGTEQVTAAYSGGAGFAASSGTGALRVEEVATRVAVHCAHSKVAAGATVACTASVGTQFGVRAALPAGTHGQVTVSVPGDRVVFSGRHATSCRWTATTRLLSCAFTVKLGHATGGLTIRAHYAGAAAADQLASVGSVKISVVKPARR